LLIFLFLLQGELGYDLFDPTYYQKNQGLIISAFFTTLLYTALVIPLGMVIGFLTGWARMTKFKFLSYPATIYVDLVRGIPPIVLILFAFFFGPFILPGLMDPTQSGRFFAAMALALHTGAYQAEIFRAGFQSIPKGQVEAATAVGLSKGQAMTGVVLPQTFRLVLPALGNELATVLKDTSLLGAIGILDLFGTARSQAQTSTIYGGGLQVFTWWTVVAILYFVLTFSLTRSLQFIERRYQVPGLGSVSV
jgi:polar amino acid transport system permease protein